MLNKNKIRTIVIEDEEKILNNICGKIKELDESFEIVAKAQNGSEALEKIEEFRPQVVFTDICMPVMGGMEMIKRIRQLIPSTVIVIISGYSDFSYAQEAIRYSVFNYLLKPLEKDELLETLFDIKQCLAFQGMGRKRHIAYSTNYQLMAAPSETYFVCAVCIGSFIHNVMDEDINQFYSQSIAHISWDEIMEKICSEEQEWLVIDEHAVNQKIIEIKMNEVLPGYTEQISNKIIQLIREKTELAVTVCTGEHLILKEELQDHVKRLRNILRQKLVIGENRVLCLETEERARNDVIEIVKMKLNQYIKNYFINKEFDEFIREIETIFKYMKSNHATQVSVEKICTYVLRMLEFSDQGYEKEMVEDLSEEMLNSICICTKEDQLFEKLIQEFQSLKFCIHNQENESDVQRILEYVNENYLTIDCIEHVAEKFGYNYAYLSRVFKKNFGESMNKYITKKKINLAKELIETKPKLKLTEVSELCGYNDSRYFSRVFKKEIGVSPSEYKERVWDN